MKRLIAMIVALTLGTATYSANETIKRDSNSIPVGAGVTADDKDIRMVRTSEDGKPLVEVTSSTLPAGAATAAKQDEQTGKLGVIESKATTILSKVTSLDDKATTTLTSLDNIYDKATTILADVATVKDNSATIMSGTTSIDGKVTTCNTGAVTVTGSLPAGENLLGYIMPYVDTFECHHEDYNSKQSSGVTVWTPGDGKRIVLMGYTISTKDYQTCWMVDGNGNTIIAKKFFSPRGGMESSSAFPRASLGVDVPIIFFSTETDCDHSLDLFGYER